MIRRRLERSSIIALLLGSLIWGGTAGAVPLSPQLKRALRFYQTDKQRIDWINYSGVLERAVNSRLIFLREIMPYLERDYVERAIATYSSMREIISGGSPATGSRFIWVPLNAFPATEIVLRRHRFAWLTPFSWGFDVLPTQSIQEGQSFETMGFHIGYVSPAPAANLAIISSQARYRIVETQIRHNPGILSAREIAELRRRVPPPILAGVKLARGEPERRLWDMSRKIRVFQGGKFILRRTHSSSVMFPWGRRLLVQLWER